MTENPLDLVTSLHFEYFWRGFSMSAFLLTGSLYFDTRPLIVGILFLVLGFCGVKYSQYMRDNRIEDNDD